MIKLSHFRQSPLAMAARLTHPISLGLLLWTSVCCPTTRADTVAFRPGQGPTPLATSPPLPEVPIGFFAPLDGNTYGNACLAAFNLGGELTISRDDTNRTIELGYDGNVPPECPIAPAPVNGAEGVFGPLDPGHWTLNDPHGNTLSFTVVPEPTPCRVWLLVVMIVFRWRHHFAQKRLWFGRANGET